MFAPITWMDRDVMYLPNAIAVALMLVMELVRSFMQIDSAKNQKNDLRPGICPLNRSYTMFFDEKAFSSSRRNCYFLCYTCYRMRVSYVDLSAFDLSISNGEQFDAKSTSSSVTSYWSSSIMNWRFSRCHWWIVFSFFNSLVRMIIPYI
jgi:hypothetical protein